jgi:hypothetical protein
MKNLAPAPCTPLCRAVYLAVTLQPGLRDVVGPRFFTALVAAGLLLRRPPLRS